jgi:dienelactone hydrolase
MMFAMTTTHDQGSALPPDFTRRLLALDGVSKTVYVSGAGPAVVLLPEMPGISPDLIRLARWIRDAGLTVYLPSLFGVDGAIPTTEAGERVMGGPASVPSSVRSPAVARAPSRHGSGSSRAKRMKSAEVRASGRSGCASPETSRSR